MLAKGFKNMGKQKGIQHYFKPSGPIKDEEKTPPAKRLKISEPNAMVESAVGKNEKQLNLCKDLLVLDEQIGSSWFTALENEFTKPYFRKLNDFVCNERKTYKVYPNPEDVWSWTRYCQLQDVKVVIIGQDPYHNPGQAHGLCFSVRKGVKPPPSLVNIYKELTSDLPTFKQPHHGYLTEWAAQGVLLLNACLTVRENQPNSHSNKGWEQLTDAVIKSVSDANSDVVFLLWGNYAQKKAAVVDKKKHHLLNAAHPSPLSASRGFLGCKHFSKCNTILEEAGKPPIDWCLND